MGYELDGLDIKTTYGIRIVRSTGPLDFLKRKGPTGHNWLDEDGEEAFVLPADIVYEPRDIVLHCNMLAVSQAAFVAAREALGVVLEGDGLHTLEFPYTTKVYSVYYYEATILRMLTKWNNDTHVGEFFLKFREPNPARST